VSYLALGWLVLSVPAGMLLGRFLWWTFDRE
jgi:hypothetical protein